MNISQASGFGLLEIVVGGALLLGTGMMLNKASTKTVMMEERHDQNYMMRRILDRTATEVFRNAQFYFPLNAKTPQGDSRYRAYYGCFSKEGLMQENREDSIEFGITTVARGAKDLFGDPIAAADLTAADYIKHHTGFNRSKKHPCIPIKEQTSHYVAFILPMATKANTISFDTYIWVYAVKVDGSIIAALKQRIVTAPYL